MKKRLLAPFVLSALFFAACGGGQNSKDEQAKSESGQESVAVDSSMVAPGAGDPAPKGLSLIEQQDCKTCHKVDVKLVGPAYKEVAQKYPNTEENVNMLADKIIKGGSGNWGEVAMLPHPSISKEDAKEMASYILSLK